MSLGDILTPKNTEELKPGLFIQKKGKEYKQINPLAWNGQVRWGVQLRTIFSLRTLFTMALIMFLAWSYLHDVQEYKEFYERVSSNPVAYCLEIDEMISSGGCNDFQRQQGLCFETGEINFEVIDGYTSSV